MAYPLFFESYGAFITLSNWFSLLPSDVDNHAEKGGPNGGRQEKSLFVIKYSRM
jgi:hypothetical protein